MINIADDILLMVGSFIIMGWGIAHIVPTRAVVKGFGEISPDARRIITMEWLAEGLTLIFIGLLVLLVNMQVGADNEVTILVARASAGMLLVMAALAQLTGARTPVLAIKICPWVKTTVAILFIAGSVI